MDLFEKWPGSKFADHARGNKELQRELQKIFMTKTCHDWLDFANEHNTTLAPVNTPANIGDDPQFRARMGFYPIDEVGCEQLPLPVFVNGDPLPCPTMAPTVGEHNDAVMAEVLGKSADEIATLKESGAFG